MRVEIADATGDWICMLYEWPHTFVGFHCDWPAERRIGCEIRGRSLRGLGPDSEAEEH
jgi:hypothetical protein